MTSNITAPSWSKEDEIKESNDISIEERKRINRDLYGSGSNLNNFLPESEVSSATFNLAEAIEKIPNDKKKAYLEGMTKNPKSTARETDATLFLKREEYNAEAAAKRVVKYWNLRKKVFKDRAFNSMVTDGSCQGSTGAALNDEDMNLLREGPFQILPPDNQDRTVLLYNKSVYNPSVHTPEGLVRCLWYMVTLAMESECTRENGLVLVCNFKYYDASHFSRRGFKLMMEFLNSCIPVRVVALHYCYGSTKSAFELVLPMMKQVMGPELRQRLCLHTGDNQEIYSSLATTFGINNITLSSSCSAVTVASRPADAAAAGATPTTASSSSSSSSSSPFFPSPLKGLPRSNSGGALGSGRRPRMTRRTLLFRSSSMNRGCKNDGHDNGRGNSDSSLSDSTRSSTSSTGLVAAMSRAA